MSESLVRSRFHAPEVDCPSEESAIKMALEGKFGIKQITVDYQKNEISVVHAAQPGVAGQIRAAIPFKAALLDSTEIALGEHEIPPDSGAERKVLIWLMGLNFGMFVIEMAAGLHAESSGLIADGLDMLADSLVYLLSLVSVHLGLQGRIRATRLSALFQGLLGFLTLLQASWRFMHGSEPEGLWMSGVSVLALAVNVTCLLLISRFRTGRMHMQASWIFSANDVIANIAVLIAGALVSWTGSRFPDLVVGVGICMLVLRGSIKISRLATGQNAGTDPVQ